MSLERNAQAKGPTASGGVQLRPSERVMEYLMAEFDRPDRKRGSRLPAMRELAARLNVSQPTVHTVLQKLVRQGRIRTVAGSGTFLVTSRRKASGSLRIALNLPWTEGSGKYWCHRIISAIMLAACQGKRRINLIPLPRLVTSDAATISLLLEDQPQVDALILFPLENDASLRRAYEGNRKPVVDIIPPTDTATANFVTPDYFGSSLQLGKAWRDTGRRRIALLGTNFDAVVSERLRYAGLAAGLGGELGNTLALRVIDLPGITEDEGCTAMQRLLADPATQPDAVYCGGDYQALGVLRACREHGVRVPEDISVIGGTGLDLSDTPFPQLSRVKQPYDQLGQDLVSMVCQRIDQKNTSLPGRVVPTGFMGGATTRPTENERLGIREAL